MKRKLIPKKIRKGLLGMSLDDLLYYSANLMDYFQRLRNFVLDGNYKDLRPDFGDIEYIDFQGRKEPVIKHKNTKYGSDGGWAEAVHLMSPEDLEKVLTLIAKFEKINNPDYGIISHLVPKNTPMYQVMPNSLERKNLTYIGSYGLSARNESQLFHAGSHAGELYMDADGNIYDRKLDYNNYGLDRGLKPNYDSKVLQFLGNTLDKVGSPIVVTSGYQPIRSMLFNPNNVNTGPIVNIDDIMTDNPKIYVNDSVIDLVKDFVKKNNMQKINGRWVSTLPETTVTAKSNKRPLLKRK